ncbi:CopD family protein [Azohydromonas lata]|uniref:Protoporphyrinogen IX oxidase n=1 Tax=Azohydromonas lata TaxID=45677 RepID=A0ABU5IMI1_9BURK|nr:CopD family protein [Azohydromonas lata]MDZ5460081.1 CopD family protein [Azohydromonas lata]
MTGYTLLKVGHLLAVTVLLVGLSLLWWTLLGLQHIEAGKPGIAGPPAETVLRLDALVTSPALLLAWGLGLALARLGGWFPAPWLLLKLTLVVLLSAWHGLLSGHLRRRLRQPRPGSLSRWMAQARWMVPALAVAIVVLAIAKPAGA